jgi:phage terminase large subunit GpA-like protein
VTTQASPAQVEAARALARRVSARMAPPPPMTVSEWADEYRRLSPESSAEPGRWRTDRAPYMRGIMDAISDPRVRRVSVKASAQVGKTELILNVIGYHVDYDPCPMLLVQPSLDLAEAFSKDRLAPMIRDTPALRGKVRDARSRDSDNTLLHKKFAGGQITMAGSNAPSSLASRPVRKVLLDEVDRYPHSAGTEGDPATLAEKRMTTFFNRQAIWTSTPTIKGRSRIDDAWEASDKRRFHLACPRCQAWQWLKWAQIRWDEGRPSSARYHCESCGEEIPESQKLELLKRGRWIAEGDFHGSAGFHLNELYSPWRRFEQIVSDFLEAKKNPETLKVWVNTSLGECWEQQGEAPEWKRLYDRREAYSSGSVPSGVRFLTAGVDVQKDRLEWEVKGWGRDKQNWSIERGKIFGDTSGPLPWQELDALLSKQWRHDCGVLIGVRMLAVDSGFNTQAVYNWARRHPGNRVLAIKGQDSAQVMVGAPSPVDVTVDGRKLKRGFRVWPIGVSLIKSELYGLLKLEKPLDGQAYPAGFCHFPADYDDEYFQQLTAEKIVTRTVRGYARHVWEKMRERNEALDLAVYNRAAANAVGIDRFNEHQWQAMAVGMGLVERAPAPGSSSPEEPGSAEAPAPRSPAPAPKPERPRPQRPRESFWRR